MLVKPGESLSGAPSGDSPSGAARTIACVPEALLSILVILLAALVAVGVWAVLELRRERPIPELDRGPTFAELVRDRVAVHLVNGDSLEGVVVSEYPEAIALAHAVALLDNGSAHALEGETVIERRRIAYVQRLTVPSRAVTSAPVERDGATA